MSNHKDKQLTRPSGDSKHPTAPAKPKPGSTLLELAKLALEKSGQATGRAGHAARRAAHAAGRAARAAGHAARRLIPEKPEDIAVEEVTAVASHASAHVTHKFLGPAGVGVKGGLEVIALVVAKLKKASPRVMRGLRSSLRGTLHHSLGTGLHRYVPLSKAPGTTTSGADEEADVGEAAPDEDDGKNTDF